MIRGKFKAVAKTGIAILFLALLSAVAIRGAAGTKYIVYVGTYTDHGSRGIYAYAFDVLSGQMIPVGLAAQTVQPSFLANSPDGKFLYAINETNEFQGKQTGGVSSFLIDKTSGKLELQNEVSSLGPGPAFITLDRTGRYVFVANYAGGSVSVYSILPDGRIGDSTYFVQHKGSSVNKQRQETPHAHAVAVSPDNRFILVADLGLDQILVYPFDASRGTLGAAHIVKTEPGAGPRHLTFSADGKFVYVINELKSSITVFTYKAADASMSPVQTVSTLPAAFKGTNTCAEIVVHPNGKFLYGSNRGEDTVALFSIDPAKGTLTRVENVSTGGKTPRNFAVDPTGLWLLAANQNSNTIFRFKINRETGRLAQAGPAVEVPSPAMVDFVARGN